MIAVLLIGGVIALIFYIEFKRRSFWAEKHVPTGKLSTLIEDSWGMLTGKASMAELTQKTYNKLQNARYQGTFMFQVPALMLKCPKLIRQICVKDFDHFLNHRNVLTDGGEELWSKNLITLKGQAWKNMRSTLSPSFTSSKMKAMFLLICNNANLFVQYFLKQDKELIEVEFKDAYTRYTNDVIASTAFGLQVDSLEDKENEFYLMGKDVADFTSFWKKMVFFFYLSCPSLAKLMGLQIFGKKVNTFFINLVKDTIKLREEQNIQRPDMLGLLLDARKGQLHEQEVDVSQESFAAVNEHLEAKQTTPKDLTDIDIASQVFVFFLAGFDSVSTAMCFTAYEIAVNPDIQKRLIAEIDEKRPKSGTPTYETIMSLTYMDMVISESLRKWPIAAVTDRQVTKPYTISPELPDEKPVYLEVDTNIMIPIFGIHRDPKHYPDPDKFDPERFSSENRENIEPYTYLPFGVGPRNCIGSRFALLEMKAVFFYLLSHFEIVPVEKTQIPLKISKASFNITSENLFPLGLKRRR